MPNPCGQVHMPNFPCRECDRIRADKSEQAETLRVLKKAMPEKFDGDSTEGDDPSEAKDEDAVSEGMESSGEPDRLAVAREALSAAERQRKFREKDPGAYRKWNRERMRLARKNRKSDGSPKQP